MSLFGNRPAATSMFGAGASTASPFGQPATTTTQPVGGSLFGAPAQAAPQPTSSLFGAPAQQPAQQAAQQSAASGFGFGFGTQPQAAFGASTQAAPQQPLQQSVNQSNLWGASVWQPGQPVAPRKCSASLFPLSVLSSYVLTLTDCLVEKPIPDQIATLIAKWRPDTPNTVFKEYFYNKVDENRVPFFQPQAFENPREWEEALQNKPAPGYLPVLCTGFEGLATRLRLQRRTVATFNAGLHEINTKLDAILSQHDLQTSVRALAARRRHNELSKRCLALAAKTQVLRNRGYALSGDEDDLKLKLQALEKTMQDPALSARMEELWSRLIVLRNYADALRVEINKRGVKEEEGLGEDVEAKAKKVRPVLSISTLSVSACLPTDNYRSSKTTRNNYSTSRKRLTRSTPTLRPGRRIRSSGRAVAKGGSLTFRGRCL